MNQQQLQIARAALWHPTASAEKSAQTPAGPLLYDAAARWLEDMGLCLFLPRPAQLPAPAPSLVEACLGATSSTPAPGAIAQATELAARLVSEDRAVALNLLGTYSEQPDFLITPEVLPWVAAIRGDRQWKAAPGGRTPPLILRTWEVLDREGESTAVALREILGRELTEAAVLRALVALWTGLRAIPIAVPGEPTRWTLLKHRFPAQMATGANTAQSTALSALLSIYLRSAVAATAEEAEVILSPLTSRSRIREVLHGMMAARQFATMSVGSQTLLFVEGSLPDIVLPEPAPEPIAPAAERPRPWREGRRPPGPPARQQERRGPQRFGPAGGPRRFTPAREEKPRREIRPAAEGGAHKPSERSGTRPWQRRESGPAKSGARPARPWQRSEGRGSEGRGSEGRGSEGRVNEGPEGRGPSTDRRPAAGRGAGRPGERSGAKPWQRRESGPAKSGAQPLRPWQRRREGQSDDRREARGPANDRRPASPGEGRPWRKPAGQPGQPWQNRPPRETGFNRTGAKRPGRTGPDRTGAGRTGAGFARGDRAGSGFTPPGGAPENRPGRPARPFRPGGEKGRPAFGGASGPGSRPDRRSDRPGPVGARPARPGARPQRPGTRPSRPGARPQRSGTRPPRSGPPFKKSFKNPSSKSKFPPGKQKPRKNRNQEETPE
ncbi:MAG TPA: hypothetical protein VHX37_18290 [Acidobacteriaceae bacterium]|nr:hypothetical protein [Acidobacteriaceae bacterium]